MSDVTTYLESTRSSINYLDPNMLKQRIEILEFFSIKDVALPFPSTIKEFNIMTSRQGT